MSKCVSVLYRQPVYYIITIINTDSTIIAYYNINNNVYENETRVGGGDDVRKISIPTLSSKYLNYVENDYFHRR